MSYLFTTVELEDVCSNYEQPQCMYQGVSSKAAMNISSLAGLSVDETVYTSNYVCTFLLTLL